MAPNVQETPRSLFSTPGIDIEMCDRCGIRARVRVVLDDGGELYFCRHHADAYRDEWKQRMYLVKELPL